jgi:hypothetical protein
LANYQNPELDFSDIVAYSGAGTIATYTPGTNGTDSATLKTLELPDNDIKNLDVSIVIGLGKDGTGQSQLVDKATATVYFNNSGEALDYLKRVIAAGYPVQVVLDRYYLYDDFVPVSSYWKSDRVKEHGTNWFSVTGYDKTYFYVNDPTDPTTAGTNLPAKVDNFRLAWENTTDPELQTNPRIGPYFMFYLSQKGTKKTVEQIIAWNVKAASSAVSNIREFSANTNNSEAAIRYLYFLAVARLEFANFLEKNGKIEAASLYRESGNLFATLSAVGGSMATDLNTIADKEEKALNLLKK